MEHVAIGKMMHATLVDGVLAIVPHDKWARRSLDWTLDEREDAWREKASRDETMSVLESWKAAGVAARATEAPVVLVTQIDRAMFKNPTALLNGSITIHSGNRKAVFIFRRNMRDECRAFYDELLRQMEPQR